jgi:ComF family protein
MGLWDDFLNLLYPDGCAGCFATLSPAEKPLCYSCRASLPMLISKPVENNSGLEKKFKGLLPLRHCLAFLQFQKGGITQRLLHALKYQNKPEVGTLLGILMANELTENGLQYKFDLVIPIPLHSSKLKSRGYNQAMAFAQGLADGFQTTACDSILVRTLATETQTRKGKLQRILNVGEVFAISPTEAEKLVGKNILLVDDVITTGSTMESCAKLFGEFPIQSLSIACLAVA